MALPPADEPARTATLEGPSPSDAGLEPAAAGPFLKWAGGKRQLLALLAALLPRAFGTYFEPFLGGGALFFELVRRGRVRRAVLGDVNGDLILTYRAVRDHVDALIEALIPLRDGHDEAHYYAARERFNAEPGDPVERAALVIYLNQTGFNGLFRVNRQGRFNVPYGRYVRPAVFHEARLRAASAALQCAELRPGDFATTLADAAPGDFAYLDPPYVPLSATAHFTAYARGGFDAAEQQRLAETFARLTTRGVHAMLSNHQSPQLRGLYDAAVLTPVPARRAINSRGDRRGVVAEVLLRNYR